MANLLELDLDAKAALGYKEAKSKVYRDGREVLVGKDWAKRVRQLRKRSGGRCEWLPYYSDYRCIHVAQDPHHLTLRSELRDDRLEKLQHLCRWHHQLADQKQRDEHRAKSRERKGL